MIRVLRIINRFNLGGPTYNVTFLSKFLAEDFETKLIGGGKEEHEGDALFIPQKYGLKPELVDTMVREINFKSDRKAYKEIRRIIKTYRPDIVHTHASKSGAIGRYAAYKENVPVIVHTFHGHVFHSYFGRIKTNIYKLVERYLAKKSDAIVAISHLQSKELSETHRIVKKEKVKVIPLGFDLNKFNENKDEKRRNFRNHYDVKDDVIAIGLIGRFAPIKNHSGFVDSIAVLTELTKRKIKVFFIGDGELKASIQTKVKCFPDNSNISFVFTSWIKDVSQVLPGLDIVALSSFNEGTPVSLIEAQASGVPVVSTDVGGVRDIVEDGKTGIITREFDAENYAKALLLLVEDEELRKEMAENGWENVNQKFHYNRLCKDMEVLYRDLLNKKK